VFVVLSDYLFFIPGITYLDIGVDTPFVLHHALVMHRY